jgi:ferredoxin
MANKEDKYNDNVDGPYYVDEQCIACGVCPTEAPDNFRMNEGDSYAYVYKQPANEEEKEAAASALESCPTDAIGDDG